MPNSPFDINDDPFGKPTAILALLSDTPSDLIAVAQYHVRIDPQPFLVTATVCGNKHDLIIGRHLRLPDFGFPR
jgi:hypothetical protein